MYPVIKKNPFYKIYFSLNLGEIAVLSESDLKVECNHSQDLVSYTSFSDSLQIYGGEGWV